MRFLFLLFCLLEISTAFIYSGHYFGFVPELISVVKNYQVEEFSLNCFNNINISLHNNVLSLNLNNKSDYLCSDTLLIANHHRILLKHFYLPGLNTIILHNVTKNEIKDIDYYGLNIFYLKNGLFGSIIDLYKTSKLFLGSELEMEQENLEFIRQKMKHNFEIWNKSKYFNEDEIKSGDYFSITRLDGLDPMIMWGTGSFSGHTAIALRINGELFVCESTDSNPLGNNYWPAPYGIIKTPYKEWLKLAEKAGYLVAILRLNDNYQNIFDKNTDRVIEFFNTVEGLPYGKNNFLFGWIDTENDNYPEGLTSRFITNIAAFLTRIKTTKLEIDIFLTQPLNKRLSLLLNETTKLELNEIIEKTIDLNYPLSKLMTIPEKDIWDYPDGKSYVCNTFVTEMYKQGGIFNEINNEVESTEFSPRDSYMVKIYNKDWLPKDCNNGNNLCQIMGKYKIILPQFNTIDMYPKMNQNCPSLGPRYFRPEFC